MITLARFLDIPPSTMTSLIDNLHKRQLVKRKYSENNRREVIVEATSKAEKIIVEFNKLIHAKFSKTLSQTESITLAKLINKFNQPFL